ncbi:MAG TPA: sugar phosphate isomerase/epimerase family protein [Tepidisphaeraceae bacterium]|jgi:2-keto-myo-inositol isomerase|nr:sugar phosphate isomerase/epimerase family protein [Tepidisphaeraceae bacterium]
MTEQPNRKRTRREVIAGATAALAVAGAAPLVRSARQADQSPATGAEPFKYCLNTSTIRGQNIGIAAEVDLAAKVGFQALEPWVSELETYKKKNGSLKDLRKQIDDSGLKIADAIGFAPWIVDDDAKRNAAIEQAKREMDMVAQVGGTHIAAPPAGATSDMPLPVVAERYAALIEAGKMSGVTPILELWGHSKVLSKIGEVAYVACESHQFNSAILLDIYHIYKGGSDFSDLHLLAGKALPLIHTNDYPDKPDRAKINDSFRVYPGDGVAPLKEIFHTLRSIGFDGYLSVELFNRTYWKQSPLKVAQASIDKTRAALRNAFAD